MRDYLKKLQIFNSFLISIAVLQNVSPDCRVTKKSHLFDSKHRSGLDRESKTVHGVHGGYDVQGLKPEQLNPELCLFVFI
jgi:hypothetical protein